MRKAGFKAILALLTLNETGGNQPSWDRIVLITSTAVTVSLVALYAYGKAAGRW